MAGLDVTRLKTPKTRARSKKKAHCQVIVLESSEGSVDMSKETASAADEDEMEKVNLRTIEAGPSLV